MSLFMTEAKVLVALLARGFELHPEVPQEAAFTVTMLAQLTSNAGSKVKFVKLIGALDGDAGHSSGMVQQVSARAAV
jgi:hypothetical protein